MLFQAQVKKFRDLIATFVSSLSFYRGKKKCKVLHCKVITYDFVQSIAVLTDAVNPYSWSIFCGRDAKTATIKDLHNFTSPQRPIENTHSVVRLAGVRFLSGSRLEN